MTEKKDEKTEPAKRTTTASTTTAEPRRPKREKTDEYVAVDKDGTIRFCGRPVGTVSKVNEDTWRAVVGYAGEPATHRAAEADSRAAAVRDVVERVLETVPSPPEPPAL